METTTRWPCAAEMEDILVPEADMDEAALNERSETNACVCRRVKARGGARGEGRGAAGCTLQLFCLMRLMIPVIHHAPPHVHVAWRTVRSQLQRLPNIALWGLTV